MEYFLDRFLAKRQVNLIGGSSGAGKTTLIFQLYRASREGVPFLGMKVPPIKWGYIAGDRTAESVMETQKRVGAEDLKIFSLVDKNLIGAELDKKVIPMLPAFLGYKPDLVYVDGFTVMVPDGDMNNYHVVAKWIARLQRFCSRQDMTILGAAHVPKVREGDRLLDPRQRIMGSAAFGGYTEDMIIIDRVYKKDQESARLIHILPRNGQERQIKASFQDGLIVPDMEEEKKEENRSGMADFLLGSLLVAGARFMSADFEIMAKQKGVSRPTYYRWLAKLVTQGRLAKGNKGEYIVLASEAEDILGNYEASKSAEESTGTSPEDNAARDGDPTGGGDGTKREVQGEAPEEVEAIPGGEVSPKPCRTRRSRAKGDVLPGNGSEPVRSNPGQGDAVQEDSNSGNVPGDHPVNDKPSTDEYSFD